MKWMNARASGQKAYNPTNVEHWANMVTHGVCVGPAFVGAKNLWDFSYSDNQKWSAIIYGMALIGLFTISTCFHIFSYCGQFNTVKDCLHRGDRAMIYIYIAGSYTPWLFLKPVSVNSWTVQLRWGIWALAVAGIVYQQLFHEMFKMLETIFYICVGVVPALVILEMEDKTGFTELQLGGLMYLVGVIFFKMDGRIPFAHAIWHIFVGIGSSIHYGAVVTYLLQRPIYFGELSGSDSMELKTDL